MSALLDTFSGNVPPLVAAARWVEAILLGSVGNTIAVLAIAAIGLAMLRGTLSARRGAKAILGCFILFGASIMATDLMSLIHSSDSVDLPPMPEPLPNLTPPLPPTPNADPYAGASVPM